MQTIYLIRHSAPFIEIENYKDYSNVSWTDYNRNMILSVEGEERAKQLAGLEELKNIDSIYASDSFRAIGTAKYISEQNNLKIRLDPRINERNLGVEKIKDLPQDFTVNSFKNKDLKYQSGESLNEVDQRFTEFITEILSASNKKTVLVIHGIILMSYLQNNCTFDFDGRNFKLSFNGQEIIDRPLTNPDIFRIDYEDNKIVNITNII